ncbi:hypothetical protein O6H91_12G079700 [Diphasiastrum complanatum]|uniref:Uncharacterized protein n=1 Tax=Diphasiastrum complanatum TaxID=34168 RepID=A0ACC2C4E7_DIPCM|nr:hypothetical protein O6H91_12G079700 [Diphasiastrum complanatum]
MAMVAMHPLFSSLPLKPFLSSPCTPLSSLRPPWPSSELLRASSERQDPVPAPAKQRQGSLDDGELGRVWSFGCAGCGSAERRSDCDGSGRIQGGIGVVPGFTWWPIKAYRPCPAFLEAGGKYKRRGQSLNEVAFGQKANDDDLDIAQRLKGR